MKLLTIIALALLIIGGINWGMVGLFGIDAIGTLLGGNATLAARILYVLVGLSAFFCIPLFKYVCDTDVSRRAAIPARSSI